MLRTTVRQSAEPFNGADIVVTAQKRVERLQDVALPVTVLDPGALIDQDQSQLRDYFSQVPGLSMADQGDGTSVIAIRGIITSNFTNPTVAISIDDVPFGSSTALAGGELLHPDIDPSGLQQIEVLRGPQGTLYGASSLGGLIRYVTTDPTTTAVFGRIQANVAATPGGGLGYGLRGSINLPLGSTIAVRASGFSRQTAGYLDNVVSGNHDVNRIDAEGGRLSLLWKPADTLTIKIGALRQDSHGHGASLETTDYKQTPLFGDLAQSSLPGSGANRAKATLFTANVDLSLGWADLKSITGLGRNAYSSKSDDSGLFISYAPVTLLGNVMKTQKLTQEIRLSAPSGQSFGWLIGGFYTHERSSTDQTIDAVQADTGTFVENLLTADFPTTYDEIALFGYATEDLTPKLSVQGGIRYSHDHQTYNERDTGPDGEASPGVPLLTAATSSDHSTTFLVTPQYRFSPELMAYMRFASGYRPGGPNGLAERFGLKKTFDADTTMNYEIGLKGKAIGGRMSYDLSVYDIDWRSIQLRVTDAATQLTYLTNGGRARSTGVEASLRYEAVSGLHLVLRTGYGSARFSRQPPAGIIANKGDRLPFSPRLTSSLSVEQTFPVTDRWTGFVGGTATYVGDRLGTFPFVADGLRVGLPAYGTVDLRAGARSSDWSISVFARNVSNSRGALDSTSRSLVALRSTLYDTAVIQPRTIGLSAARTF
jgi:iron complex outermembrane receptor protein